MTAFLVELAHALLLGATAFVAAYAWACFIESFDGDEPPVRQPW